MAIDPLSETSSETFSKIGQSDKVGDKGCDEVLRCAHDANQASPGRVKVCNLPARSLRHPCRLFFDFPAKRHDDGEAIFLERASEIACGAEKFGLIATGFGAHTVITTEARPSFPHGKDQWPRVARGGVSALGLVLPGASHRFRFQRFAIHETTKANGVPQSEEGRLVEDSSLTSLRWRTQPLGIDPKKQMPANWV
jgi:hypothetical protein